MVEKEGSFPLSDREMRESLEQWIDDLRSSDPRDVILVEGKKDREALRSLEIKHTVVCLNKGMNLFDLVEALRSGELKETSKPLSGKIVILTDWDRKGGFFASRIRKACLHLDVPSDLECRRELANLVGKWLKDVESIPSFLDRLDA